jgi:hypothetical protein
MTCSIREALPAGVLAAGLLLVSATIAGAQPGGGPVAETWYGQPIPLKKPKHHVAMPSGDPASVRIKLERGFCYGFCPYYSVELSGNGDAVYKGGGFTIIKGTHKYHVSAEAVAQLVEQFKFADFWSLDTEYVAQVSDHANYNVSITIGGKTKTLHDYAGQGAGMPPAVSALENAIDLVAGSKRWVEGDDETIPYLIAEGWNFKTADAGELLADLAGDGPDAVVLGLIANGAPLNELTSGREYRGPGGETALQRACAAKREHVIQALITAGAGEGCQSQNEKSP